MAETAVVPFDDPGWLALVERRPEATAFHHPGWARTLAAAYGFEPFVVALVEAREIVAGVPLVAVGSRRSRRWVSLPFTDACSPLGEADEVQALLAALERLRASQRIVSVELRCAVNGSGAFGSAVVEGRTHEVSLDPDPARVKSRFHGSQTRRNIERARREGVQAAFEHDRAALVDTYYRLHLHTRRRQGVPVQPRRFFRHLWEHVMAAGQGFVVVARLDGRPAASAVFLLGNGTLTYKFGASDAAMLHARPNHAVFWTAIEWACRSGFHTFDMGRTDLDNEGLRAFKMGWGASERPLVYTHLGQVRHAARSRARFLRPLIVHSPAVVCRALGEALYRRAA